MPRISDGGRDFPDRDGALPQKATLVAIAMTFGMLSVGTAPLTVAYLLTLVFWTLSGSAWRDRYTWFDQEWFVPLLALACLPWVGILWSSAPLHESLKAAERSHYWLFALIAASTLRQEGALRQVICWFLAGTVLVSLYFALYLCGVVPVSPYLQKMLFTTYITFSLQLVTAVLLLSYLCRTASGVRLWLLLVLIMFLVLMVTQLNGRSAYLALLLFSPWIVSLVCRRFRLLPFMGGVALIAMLFSFSPTVRDRIALVSRDISYYRAGNSQMYQLPDGTQAGSAGIRLTMWKSALEIFQRHPILGAGTAGYQTEVRKNNPDYDFAHPHNSYLYILACYGLVGGAMYGWLFWITVRRAWLARYTLSGHTILAFLGVVMIGSLTDTQITSVASGVALGFAVGIPAGTCSHEAHTRLYTSAG